ncbi:expressed conserved protein [Echinococcus multilocularis]|uniref:Expressed conserved protein n=1 Tax=Echinococcus multilocularis TaxID=6211 RepID=A0A068Y4H9_ECHMU|nr:expressed conserved protein [Echinococcus multilocularis]
MLLLVSSTSLRRNHWDVSKLDPLIPFPIFSAPFFLNCFPHIFSSFEFFVMSLNSKPPDYLSMTRGQLQLALGRQLALRDCLSSKLPDSGKKLNESIARVQSILETKLHQPPLLPPSALQIRSPNCRRLGVLCTSSKDIVIEKKEEVEIEDVGSLIDGLVSLNLGPTKSGDVGAEEDLSQLPKEPLTPDEITILRRLCNLPRLNDEGVSYHAFLFQLRPINSELVRLMIIDCWNSTKQFVRHGAIFTWAIEGSPLPHNAVMRCDTDTAAPGIAVAEMWRFVQQESAAEWSVLVADCAGSLVRLRRLFCCPSVRHHPGARNAMPRNIRFIVADDANSEKKAYETKEQQLSEEGSTSAISMACTAHYTKLDAAALAKLRPKTVAWIEAPLNLHALRAIAEMPRGPVVCHPPYTAPSFSSCVSPKSDQQTTPGSSPMLNSVNKSLLIRLAATGFNPSSLALLAGQARWRGFAGLLATSHVSRCPEDLANLYRLFRRVHRGLVLNTDLYREDASKPSCSPLWSSPLRQLKTLSMKESLKVMTRVRDELKASQKEAVLEARLSLPPASAMLLKYREQQAEESDDTLCADSDDD